MSYNKITGEFGTDRLCSEEDYYGKYGDPAHDKQSLIARQHLIIWLFNNRNKIGNINCKLEYDQSANANFNIKISDSQYEPILQLIQSSIIVSFKWSDVEHYLLELADKLGTYDLLYMSNDEIIFNIEKWVKLKAFW